MVGRPSLQPKAQKGHAMLPWVLRRIYVCYSLLFSGLTGSPLAGSHTKRNTHTRGSPEDLGRGGGGGTGGTGKPRTPGGKAAGNQAPGRPSGGGGREGGGGTQRGRDARSITGGLSRCGCRRDGRTVAERAMQPPLGGRAGEGGKGQTDTGGHPCPYGKGGHPVAERFPFPLTLGE